MRGLALSSILLSGCMAWQFETYKPQANGPTMPFTEELGGFNDRGRVVGRQLYLHNPTPYTLTITNKCLTGFTFDVDVPPRTTFIYAHDTSNRALERGYKTCWASRWVVKQ